MSAWTAVGITGDGELIMATPGQLAQAAYQASINPRVSADESRRLATLAADAYRASQES